MNVYAKFRNFPLRINKALAFFENGLQQEQEEQPSQALETLSSV